MSVNITSKTDNKLLERKEIEAEITFDGPTPTRAELRQAISVKVGANPDLTVLREVRNTFGRKAVNVVAHAYSNKEILMQTEPEYVRRRDGVGVEEKKEEKPKEEAPKEEPKKEEKPKEEKKEEKPKEVPKKEKPKEEPKKEAVKEEASKKKE